MDCLAGDCSEVDSAILKGRRADFVEHSIPYCRRRTPRLTGVESKPVQPWPEFNKLIGGYFKFPLARSAVDHGQDR